MHSEIIRQLQSVKRAKINEENDRVAAENGEKGWGKLRKVFQKICFMTTFMRRWNNPTPGI
jgi:hypothetical protein